MSEQIRIPNIEIQEVTLINSSQNTPSSQFLAFTVYPRNQNEPIIFDSIVLDEDMFSESVSGTLYFYDPAFILEQMSFTSYDIVQLKFKYNNTVKTWGFKIVEIVTESNTVSKKTLGPLGNTVPVAVKFASDQLVYKNFDTMLLRSFIGKISWNTSGTDSQRNLVDNLQSCGTIGGQGFVQYVFNEFGKNSSDGTQKQLKADNTFNDVWFKINPSHYPWSKIGVPAKIGQMMNYVCEYACYNKNYNAVNFFFWEDLDKFNFRCVESLLEEPVKATYTPSLNENDIDAIVEIQTITETPVAKLVNNGAFSGEYMRVKPDWTDPYRTILDTSDSLVRTQVVYDYYNKEDVNKFAKISTYPPIDVNDVSVVYAANKISDSNYGFFQEAYGQKELPWWNYWDSAYKYYAGVNLSGVTSEVERIESNYWQAQFDFCELPASCLKKIYEDIKWPKTKARARYAGIKRADTKWKFYRNTILGERNEPTSFYAMLTYAVPIYNNDFSGIYEYGFKEVEIWPTYLGGWVNLLTNNVVSAGADAAGRYYPFRVVTVPWGMRGIAYNLNEMTNANLPWATGDLQTSLVSPGLSAKIADGKGASDTPYAESKMMAVGQFLDKDAEGNAVGSVYVGRIVKIDVVNSSMIDLFGSQLNFCGLVSNSEYANMYVFDVENAVDGSCPNIGEDQQQGP